MGIGVARMTKRFTGEFDKQYSGVHDNGEQLTNFEVVDLLNNLSEDNEYLEKRFKEEEWHYDHIDEDRDVWKYKCQELEKQNEQLKSFKNDVYDLIDELIKKAEKDVEDLRKDAYEKGYAYNPYYYWGVAHGLEKLKKELQE